MNSNFNQQPDKVMTPEQFTQVVAAILEGKYSWACVLILRFAGYNPLHYIPYRTYNRLTKDNVQHGRIRIGDCAEPTLQASELSYARGHDIKDLSYLELELEQRATVKGGARGTLTMNLSSIFSGSHFSGSHLLHR